MIYSKINPPKHNDVIFYMINAWNLLEDSDSHWLLADTEHVYGDA